MHQESEEGGYRTDIVNGKNLRKNGLINIPLRCFSIARYRIYPWNASSRSKLLCYIVWSDSQPWPTLRSTCLIKMKIKIPERERIAEGLWNFHRDDYMDTWTSVVLSFWASVNIQALNDRSKNLFNSPETKFPFNGVTCLCAIVFGVCYNQRINDECIWHNGLNTICFVQCFLGGASYLISHQSNAIYKFLGCLDSFVLYEYLRLNLYESRAKFIISMSRGIETN